MIIQVDIENFVFINRGNDSFLTCNDFEVENKNNFMTISRKTPEMGQNAKIDLPEMSSEIQMEPWYRFTLLALEDTRASKFLERKRRNAEKKHLALPFIKQFSLSDGIIDN